MSASTVSISANPASGPTRRRAVEKKQPSALDLADSNLATAAAAAAGAADPISTPNVSFRSDSRDAIQVVKKPLPHTNAPISSTRRANGSAAAVKKPSKPPKPRWLTVVSVLTKNFLLLVVVIGLVQIVRRLVANYNDSDSDGLAFISGDFEGKFAEMESFVKKTTKMMQVQIEVVDKKLDSGIKNLRDEMSVKVDERGKELELKLKELSGRSENLEKLMGEFGEKDWVSKDELNNLLEDFRKTKGDGEVDDKTLDEFRAYAREIVEKEIEKHAADGLGRVDYALASGGASVVKHSEPYGASGRTWNLLTNRNKVVVDAQKMLKPSFGEPGECFPLKGDSGFVQIRLRSAIIPEAVTLEHVAKSVAYDRSSAPKNCRVSGWLHDKKENDLAADSENMFLLTEFTYDLDKSNAQTFGVLESAGSTVIDTIRFDFTSNHGKPHTCIYRLRVHGREPNSLVMQS